MRYPAYPRPNFPTSPGVYIWRELDQPIYIGKAKNLRTRLHNYYTKPERLDPKTRVLMTRVRTVEWVELETEEEALLLEEELIKRYRPKFNIRLMDDKRYPYLAFSNDEYRRISYEYRTDKNQWKYYGPYSDAGNLSQAIKALQKVYLFPLWGENWQKRGNPPVDLATWDNCINKIEQIVQGKTKWREELETKMHEYAKELNFEYAAQMRDGIEAISYLQPKRVINDTNSYDIIGWSENAKGGNMQIMQLRADRLVGRRSYTTEVGEFEAALLEAYRLDPSPARIYTDHALLDTDIVGKALGSVVKKTPTKIKKYQTMADKNAANTLLYVQTHDMMHDKEHALQGLAKLLGIPFPRRIECYDISNLGTSHPVAAMAVMIDGEPAREYYRRWTMEAAGQDDFAMIHWTLQERLKRIGQKEARLSTPPDLIVIDGGKGQLSAAYAAIKKSGHNIPVISLAKRYEEIHVPGNDRPLAVSRTDPSSLLLQHLRDETHRTALQFHREKRAKASFAADFLTEVRGLGPRRRELLLAQFGNIDNVMQASQTELEAVLKSSKVAETVYRQLHR